MSVRAIPNQLQWVIGAGALASIVGVLATIDAKYAIAAAVGTGGLVLLGMRQDFVLPVLIASVFVEVVSVGGVPISRLAAPLALLVILGAVSTDRVRLAAAGPLPWVTAYAFWATASLLWTEDMSSTVYQLSSLAIALIYMTAFAILLHTERDMVRILTAVSIAALAIGLLAIATFFLGVSGGITDERASGGAGDPNFFATYQVFALPLVLALAATVENGRRRVALYGVMLVIVASVLTSLSRGGVVTLVAVLLLVAGVPARRLYRTPGQKALFLAVIAVSGTVAVATTAKELVPRIEAIVVNKQDTTASGRGNGRVDLWLAARAGFQQHVFTGLGYGAFASQAQQLLLKTPGVDLQVYSVDQAGHEAHSAYLGTAAELGLPGVALFVGMLGSLAATLRRTAREARFRGDEFIGRVATALLISLIGWVIASIFLSTETSRALWIMLGMSLALPRMLAQRQKKA